MEISFAFSFRRLGWLMRLNWIQNHRIEMFFGIAIGIAPIFIASISNVSLCCVLAVPCLVLCPVSRLLYFNYGLKFQREVAYQALPVSVQERFWCQVLYTVGIGFVYSFLMLLLLLAWRGLFTQLDSDYSVFLCDQLLFPLMDVFTNSSPLGMLPVSSLHFWMVSLFFITFMIFVASYFNRFLVVVWVIWFELWARFRRMVEGNEDMFSFFKEYVVGLYIVMGVLSLLFLWLSYRKLSRMTIK